jgi:hypothetical protein
MIESDDYHIVVRKANEEAVNYFNWIAKKYPKLWIRMCNEYADYCKKKGE